MTELVPLTPRLLTALGLGAKEWRLAWQKSIDDNFRAGGRPKWAKTHRGGQILQQTGRLRQGVQTREEPAGEAKFNFIAGVNGLKYARIHQYGGVISAKSGGFLTIPLTPKAQKRPATKEAWDGKLFRPKGKNVLCTSDGDKLTMHYALVKSVIIKARPYLVIQPEDKKLLSQIVKEKLSTVKR